MALDGCPISRSPCNDAPPQLNIDLHRRTPGEMHPVTLSTMTNTADHPTWDQAMNGPGAQGYWEACTKRS